MAKVLSRCPVCEGQLGVTELECGNCKTSIHGRFDTCRFCRLAPEHLAFVETFLRCEGNLSRVEKELNLSYPTVRNRFSAALIALGFGEPEINHVDPPPPAPPTPAPPPNSSKVDPAERRREVLEQLARGTLSADDAANILRDLS